MISIEQENDPGVLRQVARLQQNEIERLLTQNRQLAIELARLKGDDPSLLQHENDRLRELLEQMRRARFAPSSEKRPGEQAPKEKPEKDPQKGHGPTPQPSLPVVLATHELPEEDRSCHACGGQMVPMGEQFEESEEITVVERQFVRTVHQRRKYRCSCNGCVVTAPAPPRLIDGGRYSVDFAIEVAVAKYLDHLPLERQSRMMQREGLEVSSQTLWDQLWAAHEKLVPTWQAVREAIVHDPIVHADETHWYRLDSKGGETLNKRFWVWNLTSSRGAYYEIHEERSTRAARALLSGRAGPVMVDGYSSYASMARGAPEIRLAHCWAHARRKFVEIESSFPAESEQMLALIGQLYALEREIDAAECQDEGERLELRRRVRNERSREQVRKILEWMGGQRVLPQSGLGKAIAYVKGIWAGLTRFLDDPFIPLDNNAAERALRGPVVGRKNHYGSKSRRGTEVAALFYTLLETAKLQGVEPKAYLRTALVAAIRQPGTITLPGSLALTASTR